jgi:glycosyltransferase involved in cell wall biosynthesis
MRQQKVAAVVTSGPPHSAHRIGLAIKRQFSVPWSADFRDPWIACNPPGPNTFARRLARRWEQQTLEEADLIVTNAPRACESLQQAFPDQQHKIVCITNGFDPDDFSEITSAGSNEIRVAHFGELYAGRNPAPLFAAARSLNERRRPGQRPAKLVFFGRTYELAAEVQRGGWDDVVEIGPQLPYRQAQREMQRSDVLLLLDGPGRRAGVPAKLYEYLGACRPILALAECDGDTAWVLRQSEVAHRLAPASDGAAMSAALEGIVAMADASDAPMPLPKAALQFTRAAVAQQFAVELDRLLGRTAAPQAARCAVGAQG